MLEVYYKCSLVLTVLVLEFLQCDIRQISCAIKMMMMMMMICDASSANVQEKMIKLFDKQNKKGSNSRPNSF